MNPKDEAAGALKPNKDALEAVAGAGMPAAIAGAVLVAAAPRETAVVAGVVPKPMLGAAADAPNEKPPGAAAAAVVLPKPNTLVAALPLPDADIPPAPAAEGAAAPKEKAPPGAPKPNDDTDEVAAPVVKDGAHVATPRLKAVGVVVAGFARP